MERPEAQRWASHEVARLIAFFEAERRFYDEMVTLLPVAVATVNADGAIRSANGAFLREFGLQRESLDKASMPALLRAPELAALLSPHGTGGMEAAGYRVHITPLPRWERGDVEWMVVLQPAPPAPVAVEPAAPEDPEWTANVAAVEAAQRLAGRVTHEANNLVMIAGGYGREILSQLPEGSPLKDDMAALLEATGRIEQMAGQLNDYSRAARSDLAIHAVRELLPGNGYKIAPAILDTAVITDRAAMESVFSALALLAGVPLTVEVSRMAREVLIIVKGFGMSAETLRQHLEALNKASREGQAGARECVMVGPRLVQAGARWRVGDPASIEIRLAQAGESKPAVKRTVLVVDDQGGIRNIVRRILEGGGYQVIEAGSGEEALSLLDRRRDTIDLLVTDMRMPGMTGRDLADRVRFRHPGTRILFISGFTDDPAVQTGILPERASFLSKPFHPEKLLDAVTKLMA